MKKQLLFIFTVVISLAAFSCNNLPYEPGVNFDRKTFCEKESMWKNCRITDYSYTYRENDGNGVSETVEVTVKDSAVKSYYFKEIDGKTELDMGTSEWEKTVQSHLEFLEDKKEHVDFLRPKNVEAKYLIENVYDYIQFLAEDLFYVYHPNIYHSETLPEFTEDAPFLATCQHFSIVMDSSYARGRQDFSVWIENFREE